MMTLGPARRRFRTVFACAVVFCLGGAALAAAEFPFEQQLMLDVPQMGAVRRVPSVIISSDGTARLELWCRTASAHVTVSGASLQIVPDPLPQALPLYMSDGQCAPERIAADGDLLATLAQVTGWSASGRHITFTGASALHFLPSDH